MLQFRWLRDNLDVIQDVKELTELLETVEDSGDVYFVPAFSGLYAPYWKKEARGFVRLAEAIFFLNLILFHSKT